MAMMSSLAQVLTLENNKLLSIYQIFNEICHGNTSRGCLFHAKTIIIIILFYLIAVPNQYKVDPRRAKKLVPFIITIENVEFVHSVLPNTCAWEQ